MVGSLTSLIQSGGAVVVVLLILSIIATALTLIKALQFFSAGVGRHRGVARAVASWSQGGRDEANAALRTSPSPASRVFQHAMNVTQSLSLEAAREDVMRVAQEELRGMRRHLRAIEIIAQSAPLLGLLGTVIGMIQAFKQLEAVGSAVDPSQLAGGIWTALLATALGLTVAIVFSIVGAWLESRVENERSVIETSLSGFFAHLDRFSR